MNEKTKVNEMRKKQGNEDDFSDIEICQISTIHPENIKDVKTEMPDDEILEQIADLFKVFGDFTRVRIIFALFKSEMCVCDLANLLGMSSSAISHQLRVLKQAKIVKFRREGKVVYYSLDDEHVYKIFEQGFEHVTEIK